MGRTVSGPCNAIAVAYHRGLREDLDGFEYEDLKDWIRSTSQDKWKSFEECETWLGREDLAVLENNFSYIGLTTYCGLVAIWLVSKAEELDSCSYYSDCQKMANLADHWCGQIAPKFERLFSELKKVGTFSNGESVFERIENGE